MDDPVGKHNGTIDGTSYFSCAPNHGLFIHPLKLEHPGKESSKPKEATAIRTATPTRKSRISPPAAPSHIALPFKTPIKSASVEPSPNAAVAPPSSIAPLSKSAHLYNTQALNPFNDYDNTGKANLLLSQDPKSSLQINMNNDSNPKLDANCLPEMEDELKRRQMAMQQAKLELGKVRMEISDAQEVSEYISNRERLLQSVDAYEKAFNKYERQLKRVNHLKRSDQASTQAIAPSGYETALQMPNVSTKLSQLEREKEMLLQDKLRLVERLEDTHQRFVDAESTGKVLEEQLFINRQSQEETKNQLKQQAAAMAEMNLDRSHLRKEIAELRHKLATILETASNSSDAEEGELKILRENVADLEQQKKLFEAQIEQLQEENARVKRENETLVRQTVEELDQVQSDSNDAARELEDRLKAKDEEIKVLREESILLKKEKELAAQQVSTLQGKLLDYQDSSQLESKYRGQVEMLRKNQDELLKKLNAQLSEKERRIDELTHLLAKNSILPTSPLSSSVPLAQDYASRSVESNDAKVSQLMVELENERVRYAELYRAKQKQERYLNGQIAKLKRSKPTQLKSMISEETEEIEDEDEAESRAEEITRLERLLTEAQSVKEENEKLLKEKDHELYSLKLRLKNAQEEAGAAQRALSELKDNMPLRSHEAAMLRNELEDLVKERDVLAASAQQSHDELRTLTAQVIKDQDTINNLQNLLNSRSEELVELESLKKDLKRTIEQQHSAIEALKRESASALRLRETQLNVAKKRVEELEQIRSKDKGREVLEQKLESLREERGELLHSLSEARLELDRLRGTLDATKSGKSASSDSRVKALENQLLEKTALITALQTELDVYKNSKVEGLSSEEAKRVLEEKEERERHIRQLEEKIHVLELKPTKPAEGGSEELALLEKELEEERSQRLEAEKKARHHHDLIELATKEMTDLQNKLQRYEELDLQRQGLLQKVASLKEENQKTGERLALKESELAQLQSLINEKHWQDKVGRDDQAVVATSGADDEAYKKIIEERDLALSQRDMLDRNIRALEHEKRLLESELILVKETLKQIKSEMGITQQHELITRAGTLIEELASTREESRWAILGPIKTAASFLRLYRPTEVDLEKLKTEYDTLIRSIESSNLEATVPTIAANTTQDAEVKGEAKEKEHSEAPSQLTSSSHDTTIGFIKLDDSSDTIQDGTKKT